MEIKENEIRPDHLKQRQMKYIDADIRWLLQKKDSFIAVVCPACGHDRPRSSFEKTGLEYQLCSACETLYVSPRPTPQILEEFYATSENYKFWNDYIFPASEAARREKIFQPRVRQLLDICERLGVKTNKLIEIGAGYGIFCEEIIATRRFDEVIAIEPTPSLAETCRKKNIKVIEQSVEHVDLLQDTVDVIASFEVIEHLFSPQTFVQAAARFLAPGGIMILTCPNVKGLEIISLGKDSDSIDIEHLNYFHSSSLSLMVSGCGLNVLDVITPGRLDVELIGKKVLGGQLLNPDAFLSEISKEENAGWRNLLQDFVATHALSSHMWVIAQKPIMANDCA